MKPTVGISERLSAAVERYSPSLIRVAFSYLKSIPDAEDAVQSVFLSYLQRTPEFEGDEHEKAWLIRVTVNRCKDLLKSSGHRSRAELSEDISYLDPPESGLLTAVLALPDRYRLPLHLYYYEGYSIAEIASILGEKSATVGTRLARARKRLKSELGDDYYE